jgi:hypothetical protein
MRKLWLTTITIISETCEMLTSNIFSLVLCYSDSGCIEILERILLDSFGFLTRVQDRNIHLNIVFKEQLCSDWE